jgi:hypothetical protein
MIWLIAALIFVAGCIGGLLNSAVTGEFKLPYRDREARVYRPGWVGTVLIGGVAAAASWGIYGPVAQVVMIGPGPALEPALRVAEFFGAVVLGFGGGRWFTAELDRVVLAKERDALEETKHRLVRELAKMEGGSE